jgi:hypothetical protein
VRGHCEVSDESGSGKPIRLFRRWDVRTFWASTVARVRAESTGNGHSFAEIDNAGKGFG